MVCSWRRDSPLLVAFYALPCPFLVLRSIRTYLTLESPLGKVFMAPQYRPYWDGWVFFVTVASGIGFLCGWFKFTVRSSQLTPSTPGRSVLPNMKPVKSSVESVSQ